MLETRKIDRLVASICTAAGIPGAAIAIVRVNQIAHVSAFGRRNIATDEPMTGATLFPIASTTKSFNATVLAALAAERRINWDTAVSDYLPHLGEGDAAAIGACTVRDLVTMRTGLPGHGWLLHCVRSRDELAQRARHLEMSANRGARFQYCNITPALAGLAGEIVTGRCWEDLIRTKVLEPLGMIATVFDRSSATNVSENYENSLCGNLISRPHPHFPAFAPAGGTMHSTASDMARWAQFNLRLSLSISGDSPLGPLNEMFLPCVSANADASAPSGDSDYALGWYVDRYRDARRLSHSGYIDGASSDVAIFPELGLGITSFVNFGGTVPARFLSECVIDLIRDSERCFDIGPWLARYQDRVETVRRARDTAPRDPALTSELARYQGAFRNAGYGDVIIEPGEQKLDLRWGNLSFELDRHRGCTWFATDAERLSLQALHPFDASNGVRFDFDAVGDAQALDISFDPSVAPIKFVRFSQCRAQKATDFSNAKIPDRHDPHA